MDFYPPIDWTKHSLHTAAISGNRTEVERLIAEGADVNQLLDLDVNGEQDVAGTPLHVALRNCASEYSGHYEVVEVLLAAGAHVQLCRKWEGTPLHDAARFGLTRIAELLISYGADVNSKRDFQHRTPLHLAAANNRVKPAWPRAVWHGNLKEDMVDYLLSRGAEIDAVADLEPDYRLPMRIPRDIGMTPLQLAAREGHVEVVRRLIERGACLRIVTAIDVATRSRGGCDTRFDEIIALLEEKQQSDA